VRRSCGGNLRYVSGVLKPAIQLRRVNVELSSITVFAGGDFRRYDDAKVGLLTHGLQYGTGCFEGIRGFWEEDDQELYLLLLRDHYERLKLSAKILTMELPYTVDELVAESFKRS
jgi:branched-subunit amino acid aminotransferase/4-amino-4-deoxychorismate lyase